MSVAAPARRGRRALRHHPLLRRPRASGGSMGGARTAGSDRRTRREVARFGPERAPPIATAGVAIRRLRAGCVPESGSASCRAGRTDCAEWFTAELALRKKAHRFKLVITVWETLPLLTGIEATRRVDIAVPSLRLPICFYQRRSAPPTHYASRGSIRNESVSAGRESTSRANSE